MRRNHILGRPSRSLQPVAVFSVSRLDLGVPAWWGNPPSSKALGGTSFSRRTTTSDCVAPQVRLDLHKRLSNAAFVTVFSKNAAFASTFEETMSFVP